MPTVLILTLNVSAPSVIKSAVGVTVKDPASELTVNDPDVDPKSGEVADPT